ncbi:MAG: NUDIX hydrolase [Hyphomicrobiales bacterium]|nr:MAG: NUDIX hydrolase [Hyphomicrobiales bacterium]
MMASSLKIAAAMSDIRSSATILLIQEINQLEVLMLKRYQGDDILSGAMMFPGGKLEAHDETDDWAERVIGWASTPQTERGLRIAAIREAFEETGIMLGQNVKNNASEAETLSIRKAIEAGDLSFYDYVRSQNITLDLQALTLFSRWQTPPTIGRRFDTHFYLAAAPKGQTPVADGREAVKTEWVTPQKALNLAANMQRKLLFPTRMNLKMLNESNALHTAVNQARTRKIHKVEPKVEQRGDDRYLVLDSKFGYGHVEELI